MNELRRPDHLRINGESVESIVQLESVRKAFRDTIAVRDICLNIHCGARFGVVGDNGAGKSSLFNMIVGTARPTCGSVRVFGLDPRENAEKVRSRIGFVSSNHPFPKWMRVSELLSFVRAFYARWNRDFELELVEKLSINLKKRIRELSTGMLARVAILVAIAHEPDLLILDEPFTGLDAVTRDEIQRLTKRFLDQRSNRVLLLATHHAEEIRCLVDSVLILCGGSLAYGQTIAHIGDTIKRVHLECSSEPNLDAISVIRSQRTSNGWVLIVNNWDDAMPASIEKATSGRIENICPVNLEDCLLFRSVDDD